MVKVIDPALSWQPEGAEYLADVDPDGAWRIDLAGLELSAGEYSYEIWAVLGDERSAASSGTFALSSPEVTGLPTSVVTLVDAAEDGMILEFSGEPGGAICVIANSSGTIEVATVPLDTEGSTRQRLRLFTLGSVSLIFASCTEDLSRVGPATATFVTVVEDDDNPGYNPFGPGTPGHDLFGPGDAGEFIALEAA